VFLSTRFLADGVRIFAGAIPLALVTGWSIPAAIVVMGVATLIYTLIGGLKAVVWADVIQLTIYTVGGLVALFIAWRLAGGPAQALELAREAGKLRVFDFQVNLTTTYTFLGGLVGGALLSAASHGTDQLIVQRLLATGSLPKARTALVGSGVLVLLQFLLFLMVGSAIWAAGLAPEGRASDEIFAQFIVDHLPSGVAGLLVAGILAAAMSTLSSSINAMASSVTLDLYATRRPEASPEALLRVGRWFSAAWAMALIGGALAFYATATRDTPVVVLALSIASITYGGLLGTYILAGKWPRALGRDVLAGVTVSVLTMLLVVFASRLAPDADSWLAFVGRLAWPWYVPLGTALTVVGGVVASYIPRKGGS
jgi:SSS family transporter